MHSPSAGELWTAEALDRLRSRRFSPAAWSEFLGRSLARARRTRAERPELVAQSRRWGTLGLAAAVPFGPRAVAWTAAWWAMADWHLGMVERAGGAPRPLASCDALTLARLWVAPIARRHPSLPVVAAAFASDALDGPLARRAGPTRFGRDFDSAADAALFLALMRAAAERGRVDHWLLAMERGRQMVAGGLAVWSYFGESRPAPALRSRQAAAVLAAGGALLATAGAREAARPLLAAAIGYRAMVRLRAR